MPVFFKRKFVESQSNSLTDPVLLWLTGGPGCSGLFALFTEIGPYFIAENGSGLVKNPYAWSQVVNLLVFESPIGVGFSDVLKEDLILDDNTTAIGHLEALLDFYQQFPQYKKNDLYLAGESYAGMYIPFLVEKLFNDEYNGKIKVKGIIVGNAFVDVDLWLSTIIPFAYYHGFVDESAFVTSSNSHCSLWRNAVKACCNDSSLDCYFDNGHQFCEYFATAVREDVWNGPMYRYSMYAGCSDEDLIPKQQSKKRRSLKFVTGWLICNAIDAVTAYFNREDIQQAMFPDRNHTRWYACSRHYGNVHQQLQLALDNGILVLMYYGNTDLMCNFLIGEKFAYRLGYKVTLPKRSFFVADKLGGFKTRYGNLELVVVQGAGHMVPSERPEVALHLLKDFINQTFATTYIKTNNVIDWNKESWLKRKLDAADNRFVEATTPGSASGSRSDDNTYLWLFLLVTDAVIWIELFVDL
uniref:Carboxypeptidase n=1 Tax=Syphacia muris TaxID=451379 RepID=A0A0N5ADK4_9BILA